MRVLMVSDVYFPRVNGVSTSIETFHHRLAQLGVHVELVVPRYGDEPDIPGITRVGGWRVPGDKEDRLLHWRSMHRTVLERASHCDLIHIQTPFVAHYAGLSAARVRRLPVLATYHTLFEEYLQHYLPMLPADWLKSQARQWSRRQCNALDAVIVPSSAMQTRLHSYGVDTSMHILPTGIPVETFAHGDRAAFRARHGIAPDRPVALFVGRVAHEKNIGFLLQALRHALVRCPHLLLVIAGEGPAVADLRTQANQMQLQNAVQFIGYLERKHELPSCYAAADLFAFASRTETQGLVLLEAMAAGLPVVALSDMGTRDILDPGQGSLSPPADAQAFGQALAELLGNPQRLQAMRDEALSYAQTWSDRTMAARLAALYQSLLLEAALPAENTSSLPVGP